MSSANTKVYVLSELLNPQTSQHRSSFVTLLIYILVTYLVNRGGVRKGEERRDFKRARDSHKEKERGGWSGTAEEAMALS